MAFAASDPVVNKIGFGAAALRYARLGYAVLPLVRGGKKPHRMLPLEPGGVHNASRSELQIEGRWSIDPSANVGVATGKVSNLVVIDLDVKGGHNGPAEFFRFMEQAGLALPRCPQVNTPSGGWHMWLRWWEGWDVPERPGILPGVDIKGNGGLVVAPPSMLLSVPASRPGDAPGDGVPVPYPYYWLGCPHDAPQAPKWLARWISTAPSTAADGSTHEIGEAGPELDELLRTGVEKGQRNDTLYRLACSRYRHHGTSSAASVKVMEEVRAVYDASDTTGMSWHEVLVIVQSARKFVESRMAAENQQLQAWINRTR